MAEDTVNTENVQEPAKDDNMITCPCCGQQTLHKPITPKQEVVDQWLACIVTGTPFSHTYPMYNGRIKITVTVVDDKTRNMLADLRVWLKRATDKCWPDKEQRPFNAEEMLARCQVLSCVKRVEITVDGKTKEAVPAAVVISVHNSLSPIVGSAIFGNDNTEALPNILIDCNKRIYDSENISSVPAELMASTVYTHATINKYMLDMGTASDFWSGIELA